MPLAIELPADDGRKLVLLEAFGPVRVCVELRPVSSLGRSAVINMNVALKRLAMVVVPSSKEVFNLAGRSP